MAQLVHARLSEQEVPFSICFDFPYGFKYPQKGVPTEGGGKTVHCGLPLIPVL